MEEKPGTSLIELRIPLQNKAESNKLDNVKCLYRVCVRR